MRLFSAKSTKERIIFFLAPPCIRMHLRNSTASRSEGADGRGAVTAPGWAKPTPAPIRRWARTLRHRSPPSRENRLKLEKTDCALAQQLSGYARKEEGGGREAG